jgi:hypothetical protein
MGGTLWTHAHDLRDVPAEVVEDGCADLLERPAPLGPNGAKYSGVVPFVLTSSTKHFAVSMMAACSAAGSSMMWSGSWSSTGSTGPNFVLTTKGCRCAGTPPDMLIGGIKDGRVEAHRLI